MKSITPSYLLLLTLIRFFFSQLRVAPAQSPTSFVEGMNGILSYPTIHNLSICEVADTLSHYLFNTSATTSPNLERLLHILLGMQSSGLIEAFDPAYSILDIQENFN